MSNHPTLGFTPGRVFKAWHDRFPKSIPHLHSAIIKPCMEEIALKESDKVINDSRLKVCLKSCTLDYIRSILDPGILPRIYLEDAPYTWNYLSVFITSPNGYRKRRAWKTNNAKLKTSSEADKWEDMLEGSTEEADEFAGETGGFGRTWTLPVMLPSIMAFTRNTGTNLFPMILGLFLEIGGTSSRILGTLSNAGAFNLMQGSSVFYIIFDNINIFLRKSQQRLFNKNFMIHVTNITVIALPHADSVAEDLDAKKEHRGKRAAATGANILPTEDDDEKMLSSFAGLVMTLILAYCPGSQDWEDRDAMLKAAEDFITTDRPLPLKKATADLPGCSM
ncbi:hypothetical protein B0H17DRAFT_1197074 [Mycena rosella]|uniref:Uncharacterized protein n=1 Tax=Mycena rosella TaxID=1033263 RepID=A0AAD7DS51_MYCRO|nr:hypothetical protein B0H17DRAFT_1197074 [Mycena rosella]